MPKIECKNLIKVYDGGIYALDGISFTLEAGDFLTVIGESGGGKTTLLKCIAGLLPITAGELFIDGELCNLSPAQERKVGVVFQELTLYPNMTVFENVAFALKKQKLSFEEECRRVREILEKMNLMGIQSALPRQISYGQKQKVALARALVKNPDIVLFDEPMSNIDEPSRVQYREMIKNVKRDYPESTFIYVTHNIDDALSMGNKTMVLHGGRILQFCESRLIYSFPNSPEVAEYIFGDYHACEATIKNGRLMNGEEEICLDSFMKASLHFKKYENKEVQYAYNDKFTAVFHNGHAIGGIQNEYALPCEIKKDVLNICGEDYDISSISEGLLSNGCGNAILKRENLFYELLDNSICFTASVEYADDYCAVYSAGETLISDRNRCGLKVGDKINIYYPVNELGIVDESGNIMLANYVLTDNKVNAKASNRKKGKIYICGKSFEINESIIDARDIDVIIERDAFSISDKKRGIPVIVINEEQSKDFTLCYAYLKGSENCDYLTVKLPANTKCFLNKNFYLEIDEQKIHIS